MARCFLLSSLMTLSLVVGGDALAEDLRCDFIFSGPAAVVSAEGQANEAGGSTLRFAFGGYAQCAAPESLGWKSFGDANAEERQVTVALSSDGPARSLLEQRLKDCHRQALVAMSNPARYVFSLSILSAEVSLNQAGPLISADSASSLGCSIGANSTGLK
ncbi:MAG: hypothetical protein RL518_1068 [Pseudomonadota bacterium]|jgi:hypothetical protein